MQFLKNNPFSKKEIVVLSGLSLIEFLAAFVALILIPHETSKGVLFGFSIPRIVLLIVTFIFAAFSFIIMISALRKFQRLRNILLRIPKVTWIALFVIAAGLAILGWICLLTTPDFWGKYSPYYERLKPLLLALGLSGFQLLGSFWFRTHKLENLPLELKKWTRSRIFWFVFGIILSVFIIFFITKWGVVLNTALWNVPGVPISNIQTFFVIFFLILIIGLHFHIPKLKNILIQKVAYILVPVLIFITTCLAWGLTPLNGHSFSLIPNAPQYQPYPFSDARVHDLGAISIVKGMGIYFHGYTDKPLYMVLLGLFHLIAGNNYILLTWLQVTFLSLIPVIGYFLGKKFIDAFFGCLLAIFIMLQQMNAIALTRYISSVNVKLLVTEGPTLLGVVLLVYLLFLWLKSKSNHHALLMGGVIGMLSLVRLNPILFLPAIGLVIVVSLWKTTRILIKQCVIFFVGFMLVFSPWLFSGTNLEGEPWIFVKIKDVLQNRVSPTLEQENTLIEPIPQVNIRYSGLPTIPGESVFSSPSIRLLSGNSATQLKEEYAPNSTLVSPRNEKILSYLTLIGQHFSHNIVTAFMALPDRLSFLRLKQLSQSIYWDDSHSWQGDLPFQQVILQVFNIGVISLGIVAAWNRNKWAGLAPLLCFFIYDLALSFSLTSGGRYLVPINWIVFFYWGFGLYAIIRFVFTPTKHAVVEKTLVDPGNPTPLFTRKMNFSILALLIPAFLILGANVLIPSITAKASLLSVNDGQVSCGIPIDQESSWEIGTLLYPYFIEKGNFIFDYLHGTEIISLITDKQLIQSGDLIIQSDSKILIQRTSEKYIERLYLLVDYQCIPIIE